ncbi:hypothetical protein [Streptomyces sp. NPDC060322]
MATLEAHVSRVLARHGLDNPDGIALSVHDAGLLREDEDGAGDGRLR